MRCRHKFLAVGFWALLLPLALVACGRAAAPPIQGADTAASTQGPAAAATPTAPVTPTPAVAEAGLSTEASLSQSIAWLVGDIDAMQAVFGEGAEAMAEAQIIPGANSALPHRVPNVDGRTLTLQVSWNSVALSQQVQAVGGEPAGFFAPLPETGQIEAPPGACPAGAKPKVTFITNGGSAVTSGLLSSQGLRTIGSDYSVRLPDAPPNAPNLVDLMRTLATRAGDPFRLATPQGWNEVLWDPMKALQAPALSLMDYQIWTVSPAMEKEVVAGFLGVLNSMGLPPMVDAEQFHNYLNLKTGEEEHLAKPK